MTVGGAMVKVEQLLRDARQPVDTLERLHGGDTAIVVACGRVVVKTTEGPAPQGMFAAEARGLRRIYKAKARAPKVLHVAPEGLVLERLRPAPMDWTLLGRFVARLHRVRGRRYGSERSVHLGKVRLSPGWSPSALYDWHHHRAGPAFQAARATLGPERAALVRRALEDGKPYLEGPVCLHGDLWSGNVMGAHGGPALLDPAHWTGERGVDLAMMELFGGFPREFWEAYESRLPISLKVRDSLSYWQLLFLLVHVAMFGEGYVERTVATAEQVLKRK